MIHRRCSVIAIGFIELLLLTACYAMLEWLQDPKECLIILCYSNRTVIMCKDVYIYHH